MIKVDNKSDFDAELQKSKRVMALFYANWCPYCLRFVPAFDKKAPATGAETIHVIMDDNDNPLWDEYDVEAVPTIIYFEDGKVSKRLDGRLGSGLNEKQLDNWLTDFKKE